MEGFKETAVVGKQPSYALVAQSLINDISSGFYAVNSLLPTEFDLCKQFGVSRHTVREAIRKLKEMGLVTRQQGVGTIVKSSKAITRYTQSMGSVQDLLQYAQETKLRAVKKEIIEATDSMCTLLKCKAGEKWLVVEGNRYIGEEKLPLAFTTVYIPIRYSGVKDLIGPSGEPIYLLIEKSYGEHITEVQQDISAVSITGKMANSLSVTPGSPGLCLIRRYLGVNDKVLEVAVNVHPAERFVYSMSFRREWETEG